MPSTKLTRRLGEKLTPKERSEFFKMLNVADKCMTAFFRCGDQLYKVLSVIRDKKLYKEEEETFAAFCEKRWGISGRRAEQLLQYGKYCEEQKLIAEITGKEVELPKNEKQFRGQKNRKPDDKPLTEVNANLGSRRMSRGEDEKRDYSDAYTASSKSEPDSIKDNLGYVVPDHILPLWKRGVEIGEMMTTLRSLKIKMTQYENICDPLFRGFHFDSMQHDLGAAWDRLTWQLPEIICYRCEKKTSEDCTLCGGRGFITKRTWERNVAKDVRDKRPYVSA